MSTVTGKSGVIYLGANQIAEVRDWSIEQTQNRVDDTVMGDSWTTGKTTTKSWSGSVNVYYDSAETDITLVTGSDVVLKLYPEGETSGLKYYQGTAHVTSISQTASFDGMVEASFSVEGTGALTIETVV